MTTTMFQEKLDDLLAGSADSVITNQVERLNRRLAQVGESFVLFGAGKLGQTTLTGLRKAGIEPLAFVDNSPRLWGQKIEGVEVCSPQDAKQQFRDKALFVVTVYTGTPVRRQLHELDVQFISFAELAWKYSYTLLPHYALNLPHSLFEQVNDVRQAMAVWADDISRNEYLAQIAWRTTPDENVLPVSTDPQEMYFQSDLFSFSPSDTIVDCGAFDGDTIRELERRRIGYRRLIAIEPDPINYQILNHYVSELPEGLRHKISLYQNAVGASRGRISFTATGTARTSMEAGTYDVECVPLDELLVNEQPAYIKMDIEGAEYPALIGGRQAIETHQPVLAICLYHCPEDLWRIPLLIRSMSDQYRLFLRRYSDECWEQVCYAVPKE